MNSANSANLSRKLNSTVIEVQTEFCYPDPDPRLCVNISRRNTSHSDSTYVRATPLHNSLSCTKSTVNSAPTLNGSEII